MPIAVLQAPSKQNDLCQEGFVIKKSSLLSIKNKITLIKKIKIYYIIASN
jgi:hypothetical protein